MKEPFTETLRCEKAVRVLGEVMEKSPGPHTQKQLRRLVEKKWPTVRENEFRSAIWQWVDGGAIRFTADRKIEWTRK